MDKHTVLCPYLEYYLAWKREDGLSAYLTTGMNLQRITLGEKKPNLGSIIWQSGKGWNQLRAMLVSLGMREVGNLEGWWGNFSGWEDICTLTRVVVIIPNAHQKSEKCMPKGLVLYSVSIMPPYPWREKHIFRWFRFYTIGSFGGNRVLSPPLPFPEGERYRKWNKED